MMERENTMEKEKYEELQMEVIEIESVDVITESNPNSDAQAPYTN